MNHVPVMRYYKQFIWLKIENDSAIIGITDFAQNKWGEIIHVKLPFLGKFCKQGEVFGLVETCSSVNDLIMPVDGLITKLNTQLQVEPNIINIDPLAEGWIIKIKIINLEQTESLLTEKAYQLIIGS